MSKIKIQVETEIDVRCGHDCQHYDDEGCRRDYCTLFHQRLESGYIYFNATNFVWELKRCDECIKAENKSLQSTQSDIE